MEKRRIPAFRQGMGTEGRWQTITRFGQDEVAAQLFTVFTDMLGIAYPAPMDSEPTTSIEQEALFQEAKGGRNEYKVKSQLDQKNR